MNIKFFVPNHEDVKHIRLKLLKDFLAVSIVNAGGGDAHINVRMALHTDIIKNIIIEII